MSKVHSQKTATNLQVRSKNQPFSKKIFKHPPKLILSINESPELEKIYNLEVNNITKFTREFIGSMITYLTHGLYKYPAKFIPQIPQFCIQQFSQPYDTILDPFCGSGSTLLEAQLLHRNAFGFDINPLARLISKVKTTPLNLQEFSYEYKLMEEVLDKNFEKSKISLNKIPNFPNLSYWFTPKVLQDLRLLQNYILHITDPSIRNFFLLMLASIIRDVSLADNDQLHPAKTRYSRIKETKNPRTFEIYRKSLRSRMETIKKYSKYNFSDVNISIIDQDATKFKCPQKVDLVVTSPPYVNALDYIRIHKLEAFWVGLLESEDMHEIQKQFVGTENVYKDYYYNLPEFAHKELNQLVAKIANFDKKRAGIVTLYFIRMYENLKVVFSSLRSGGHYCIVIGSNNIRNIHIPTPKILIAFAQNELGYQNVINYSYDVINKRLKIPRARHGGNIKKEWIIVLRKL